MLSPALLAGLNDQIRRELFSSLAYMAIHAYFESLSLDGFASWMKAQYREEHGHAIRIFDFVLLRGGVPTIMAIDAPKASFASPLEAIETAYGHEQGVTASINDLYELAGREGDRATQVMLQWFISEQLEEERSVGAIRDQVRMAGDNSSALLLIDSRIGSRRTAGDEAEAPSS